MYCEAEGSVLCPKCDTFIHSGKPARSHLRKPIPITITERSVSLVYEPSDSESESVHDGSVVEPPTSPPSSPVVEPPMGETFSVPQPIEATPTGLASLSTKAKIVVKKDKIVTRKRKVCTAFYVVSTKQKSSVASFPTSSLSDSVSLLVNRKAKMRTGVEVEGTTTAVMKSSILLQVKVHLGTV